MKKMFWRLLQVLFTIPALLAAQQDFSTAFQLIKAKATPAQLYALLYAMPKGGDLHHHGGLASYAEEVLEVSTNPAFAKGNEFFTRLRHLGCPDSTEPFERYQNIARFTYQKLSDCSKKEYAPLAALPPADREAWISTLKLDRRGEARDEFFEKVVTRTRPMLKDTNVVMELIARYIQRYGREGIRYLENQLDPWGGLDVEGRPVPPEAFAAALREMLNRPDVRASGVTVRHLVSVVRFAPAAEQHIERGYAFIDQNRDLWVGLNLVGREDNDKGNALRFLETFRKLRRRYSGIHLSIHGGEVDSPGRDVRNTLLIGAERIGHGVNLITDPETMLLMRNGRNLIEVNLVSNRLLEYVDDFSRHPFPEYLRFGIPVCLNTDDQGSWDSSLTDEYFIAIRNFNLSWDEVLLLGRNSLQYSFAPAAVKAKLLREFNTAVLEFERKFGGPDWEARLGPPRISGYARRELLK